MGAKKPYTVKSTGVVLVEQQGRFVHVDIANLDPNDTRTVFVAVRDWTSCPPVYLPLTYQICGEDPKTQTTPKIQKIVLQPKTYVEVTAEIGPQGPTGVSHYEVIVRTSRDEDFTANTWQTFANGIQITEGGTLFWKQWQPVNLD